MCNPYDFFHLPFFPAFLSFIHSFLLFLPFFPFLVLSFSVYLLLCVCTGTITHHEMTVHSMLLVGGRLVDSQKLRVEPYTESVSAAEQALRDLVLGWAGSSDRLWLPNVLF